MADLIEQLRVDALEIARWGARNEASHMLEAADKIASLRTRLAEVEKERDDALGRVDELEALSECVSAEFEGDCWKALRAILTECEFDWRDIEPEGVTAEDAREYIATTIDEIEKSETRERTRAETAEADAVKLREFAESFNFTVTDSFYSDAYLNIHNPDAVAFRLGNGSQFSKFIVALEQRRLAAVAAPPEKHQSPAERLCAWATEGPRLAKAAGCYVGIKISAAPSAPSREASK